MKIIAVLILAGLVSGKTVSREPLSTDDDIDRAVEEAKEGIADFLTSIWGKVCLVDANCVKYVAYCRSVKGGFGIIGQCRPNIGLWLVVAVIVILVLICSCVCRRLCC